MAEHLPSPRRGWVTGVHFLLLVGGLAGAACLNLWLTDSVWLTAAFMVAWALPQTWRSVQSWSRRESRGDSPWRREDVPPIVVLLVTAALLTWNALTQRQGDQLWDGALELAAAGTAVCAAAAIAFRPGRT